MDLKIEIERITVAEQIKAEIILSFAGCISKSRFRVADGISIQEIKKNMRSFH